MKVRCIALDLDRTTLYDSKTLSSGNRKALEKAIAEGVHVIIASGRSLEALPDCITGIKGIEYAITSNGAAIYRLSDRSIVRQLYLEPEFVDELLEVMEDNDFGKAMIGCEMFWKGQPYAQTAFYENAEAYGESLFGADYIKKTRIPIDDTYGFIRERREELDGLDLIIGDVELRHKVENDMKKIRTPFFATKSSPKRLEFGNVESGKGSALRFLMELLGVSAEQTAAFGDAENDIDMMKTAGYGIAVANATPECLAVADFVTKSCTEDGVAWAIETFLAEE